MNDFYNYQKYAILYVDDEEKSLKYFVRAFGEQFRIFTATNAQDGLKVLEEHKDEIGLLMTDQRMPKVTGVELLSQIRQGHPHAVRMLFTGYADIDAIIAAINQNHIFKFLRKPWQPEELEEIVREAAAEYDRIVQRAEEIERMRIELQQLRDRLTALEKEVEVLRHKN